MKYLYIPMLIFALLAPLQGAFAQSISTPVTSGNYHIGETFTVPVLLSSPTTAINAFSIKVSFPDSITFLGSDENGSIVNLWVETPHVVETGIEMSGAIPSGFTQILNPLNGLKSPGVITKLIFKTIREGKGDIVFHSSVYVNDGNGTAIELPPYTVAATVDGVVSNTSYEWNDGVPPEPFTPLIEKSDLLFEGKHVVVFNTLDKDSGIAGYEVREGNGGWNKATSPYLLKDQSLHVPISVKAIDKAGNIRIEVVEAPRGAVTTSSNWVYVLLVVVIAAIIIFFRKQYRKQHA